MEICQLRIGKSTRPAAAAAAFATAFVCLLSQVADSPARPKPLENTPLFEPHSSAGWDIFTFCSNLSTETVDVRLNAATSPHNARHFGVIVKKHPQPQSHLHTD